MTEQERQVVAACGESCHVTTTDRVALIDAAGLDPAYDDSVVLPGPKRPKAVYLCPAASLENAKQFIGDRASGQETLFVYRLSAESLSHKSYGPDIGYLVHRVGEAGWTVAVSPQVPANAARRCRWITRLRSQGCLSSGAYAAHRYSGMVSLSLRRRRPPRSFRPASPCDPCCQGGSQCSGAGS
jgi:hypothetical protein